ncbi:MAG: hypothetical protein M3121_01520, partial [Chloroflexota bacterium]|nr:hypothetical protein [Chloroflexota bacterium]
MDFVVFGTGTGAALVLIGWLGRDLGPRLRDRAPSDDEAVLGVEEMVARVSWARFCGSVGAALALSGAVLLLVTIATLVLRVSDETGSIVMLATYASILVAMTAWSWAYVRRFGVYGVVRRRQPEPERAPAFADVTALAVASAPLDTSNEVTDVSPTPEPVAADTSLDVSTALPPADRDEIAEPVVAEAEPPPEPVEITPTSAQQAETEATTADVPETTEAAETASGEEMQSPDVVTAAPAANEADAEGAPSPDATEPAALDPLSGTEQPPESAAASDLTHPSSNGDEISTERNGIQAPNGEGGVTSESSQTLAAATSAPAVLEGMADPSSAVPRAARRRRAASERHDYLARLRPSAA